MGELNAFLLKENLKKEEKINRFEAADIDIFIHKTATIWFEV